MKKKILILGHLVDFGGREIEANLIAKALEFDYNVTICSLGNATPFSMASRGLKKSHFTILNKEFIKSNYFFHVLTFLFFMRGGCKGFLYQKLHNKLSVMLNYKKYKKEFLLKYVREFDLIIFEMEFRDGLFTEILETCKEQNILSTFRTTRTIFEIPNDVKTILKKVDVFIHHSDKNALRLKSQIIHKYKVIDQSAINERELLQLDINIKKPLKYGFIGRFSNSKQILLLAEYFVDTNKEFFIAGEGELKEQILERIRESENFHYLGIIQNENLSIFFSKIDVLIISSTEESGPLVGVEAMAAGKIIISTKVGAMEERLKNQTTSFWLDELNINSLAQIIKTVETYTKEELNRIANRNREIYLKEMSLDIIKDKYLNAIKELFK